MASSARKENRWQQQCRAANDAVDRRRREIEAAYMVRGPRPPVVPPTAPATRAQVRRWMRANACDYACATTLAEGANAALNLPAGAMDDDVHWVWDEALAAVESVVG